MSIEVKVKKILVSLPPWPNHQLKWLCDTFGKSQQEIIREALIHYASYWKEHLEKSRGEKDVD